MRRTKENKGITLVALVVTIIVLLILAGIVITLSVGNNGLFARSKNAVEKHSEAEAREKLEIALSSIVFDKNITEVNDEYIDNELTKQGMVILGDIVVVDDWQFEINRSALKIETSIGRGSQNENIQITSDVQLRKDYVNATMKLDLTYTEGKIKEIIVNGESKEVPEPVNGVYSLENVVTENGIYTVLAKDENGNYKIEKVEVKDITEDMEIWNKSDMESFRDKVNSGRTFEGRTARVMADIDLKGTNEDQWVPIGNDTTQFKGTFEGNKHTISNLYIDSDKYQRVGLFYITDKLATIQNTILENIQISNKYNVVEKNSYTGGIVGNSNGKIINCGVNSGNIEGIKTSRNTDSSRWDYAIVGGISGTNDGEITKCYNKVNIKAEHVRAVCNSTQIGGISGIVHVGGKIFDCYNCGNVMSEGGNTPIIGGIAGEVLGIIIKNSYNTGNFTNTNYEGQDGVSAILGRLWLANQDKIDINNCYSLDTTTYSYKYWNSSIFSPTLKDGIVNETTLKSSASTLGDAFINDIQNPDGTWKYNNGYPILKWQLEIEN